MLNIADFMLIRPKLPKLVHFARNIPIGLEIIGPVHFGEAAFAYQLQQLVPLVDQRSLDSSG